MKAFIWLKAYFFNIIPAQVAVLAIDAAGGYGLAVTQSVVFPVNTLPFICGECVFAVLEYAANQAGYIDAILI